MDVQMCMTVCKKICVCVGGECINTETKEFFPPTLPELASST